MDKLDVTYKQFVIWHPEKQQFFHGADYGVSYGDQPRFFTSKRNASLSFARVNKTRQYCETALKRNPDNNYLQERLKGYLDAQAHCQILEVECNIKEAA